MTKDKALENIMNYFENNMDVFADCIEELDGYNGYLTDDRLYPMSEIDELLCNERPSKILDYVNRRNTAAFDLYDEYFYFDCYGLRSTDDREGHYEDYLGDYAIEDMANHRRWVDTIDRTPELSDLFDDYENAGDEDDEDEEEVEE